MSELNNARRFLKGLLQYDQIVFDLSKESTQFGDYWNCDMTLKVGDGYRAYATSRHKNQAFAYALRQIADQVMEEGF